MLTTASCAATNGNKTAGIKKPESAEPAFTDSVAQSELEKFTDQMVLQHGFDHNELQATLKQLRYVERTIQLMKPAPPGTTKNWVAYRDRFVTPARINAGAAFWYARSEEHTSELQSLMRTSYAVF